MELLAELQRLAATCSRRCLAKVVCQRLAWNGPAGEPALMSARKTLSLLHQLGHLPAPLHSPVVGRTRVSLPLPWPEPEAFPASTLADLGTVRLVRVTSRRCRLARVWKQLMAHHYLGAGPLCGHQLRYVIEAGGLYLGALAFSAAALRLRSRDQVIGWSEASRRHQLHRVVNNTRFLILPWVQVPNLASHVLGLSARLLPADWAAAFGFRPVLLESFVDTQRFVGTSYAAAGWQNLGLSAGRGRQDRRHEAQLSPKSIWIKPLTPDWREELKAEPTTSRLAPLRRPPPTLPQSLPPAAHWAEEEFRGADFGDRRLTQRLITLARDFGDAAEALIPEACGTRAKIRAAYRFLANQRVKLSPLLAPHREQTLRRMQNQSVVLAVQDTTELDYTAQPETTGLGPIGNHRPHVQGLELHPTVAFTPAGLALGVLDVQCWKRDAEAAPGQKKGFRRDVTEKEGVKWLKGLSAAATAQAQCPATRVVSVGDCEADMYELYLKAQASQTYFLVRAYRARAQSSAPELWTSLKAQPPQGSLTVVLPRRGKLPVRKVELAVRFASTELTAPNYMKKSTPSVRLWAIFLREENPQPGIPAVEWMLLTNLAVETVASAVEKTQWYAIRFQIEVYFRTLKTGCRIQDRQLACRERLENCLGIDLVVAWRVLALSRQARQSPDAPLEAFLDASEVRVLKALIQADNPTQQPVATPGLRQAVRRIAQLGGFLGRKGDGEPGVQTLWRGLQHFEDITRGFILAEALASRPVPSNQDYG